MRIALINFHYAYNYGAVLQCTALKQVLENMGHSVEIIDYRPYYQMQYYLKYPNPFITARYAWNKLNKDRVCKRAMFSAKWFVHTIFNYRYAKKRKNLGELFQPYIDRNFKQTKRYNSYSELQKNPPDGLDAYICGSDQLWNPDVTWGIDPAYYLNFGDDQVKRIAYAVSPCGLDCKKNRDEIAKAGEKLEFVSLRESEKKTELLNILKCNEITICPDPTLLIKCEGYKIYEEKIEETSYIAFYGFVDNDHKKNEILMNKAITLSKKKCLTIVDFSLDYFKWEYDRVKKINVTPGKFLSYIKNADYIVTNSFHGTVFSIIYHKQFYTMPKTGTTSRVVELLNHLNLNERILTEQIPEDKRIDYCQVDKLREQYVRIGLNYLTIALTE